MELRLLLISAALLVVCLQRGFGKPAPGAPRLKRFLRPGGGPIRAMTLEQLKCECELHRRLFECTCTSRKMLDSNSTVNNDIMQCLEDYTPPPPTRQIDVFVTPGRGGEGDSGLDTNRATEPQEPPEPECTLPRREKREARVTYCIQLHLIDYYVTKALRQMEWDRKCVDYDDQDSRLQTPLRLIQAIDKWHEEMMRRYQLCPNRTFLLGKSRRTHLDVTDATYLNYNRECSRTEIRSATERWDWQLAIIARAMHMVNEMSKLGTIGKKILRGCVNTNQVQCTNVLQNVLIGTCNTTT